jgi:hypothetical protein
VKSAEPAGWPAGANSTLVVPTLVTRIRDASNVVAVQDGPEVTSMSPSNRRRPFEKAPPGITCHAALPSAGYVYQAMNVCVSWSAMVNPQPDSAGFHQMSEQFSAFAWMAPEEGRQHDQEPQQRSVRHLSSCDGPGT